MAAITRPPSHHPGSLYWPPTPVPLGATSMAPWGGALWLGNGPHLVRWPVHGVDAEWEVSDIYAPVTAVACDGDTLLAGLANGAASGSNAGVLRVNPFNGVQLWQFMTTLPVSTLAIRGGSALAGTSATSATVGNGALHFLSADHGIRQAPDAEVEGGVNAVAATTHGWVVGSGDTQPASTTPHGDLALWSTSGTRQWQQPLPTPAIAVAASATIAVGGWNNPTTGTIEAFDTATGAHRWGPQDVGTPLGALAATNDSLIVGTQTHVQCLAIADGSVKWTFPVARQVFALAVDDLFAYVSTGNSVLGLWL